jgi:predicted ATPase
LPLPADLFLGRERELQRLRTWLGEPRRGFLSLLGAGGLGKTRLALQFAQENAAAFPGGLWLVDVSGASSATGVAQAVLLALGIPEGPDQSPVDMVAQVLQHRQPLLLILDGFDRAVDAAAATVAKWARQQPLSALIVTSRQRLGVPGEFSLEVDPLPLPAANASAKEAAANPSVQLLVARATEAGAACHADEAQAPLLVQICRQLEGIPLAIELAAARLRVLSLAQLQSRLAHQFEVLRSTRRDLPPRQQTLLGAIAWSYELLSPEEQDALLRLSLLPGGCTLDLAEGLLEETLVVKSDGGRSLDLIQSLRDRCFLRATESSTGLRFEMFRVIRDFCCQEREGRITPAQTRQDWRRITWRLLKPAGEWRDRLRSAERRLALDWFASERDNLLACQDFALSDGDHVTARHIGLLLDEFFAVRGPGAERLARLQKLAAAPGQVHASLSVCLSQALQAAGNWQAAFDAVQSAMAAPRGGNPRVHAEALLQRATVLRLLGRSDEALADLVELQQAIDAWKSEPSVSDPTAASHDLPAAALLSAAARERGLLAQQRGDWSEALAEFDRAEQLARQAGDEPALALALRYRGNILARQGKPAGALPLLQEALALAERHDDRRLLHLALSSLGMARAEQGQYAAAIAAYNQAELVARDLGEPRAIATNLGNRGLAFADQGLYAEAIECFARAEAINRQIGSLSGLAINRTNHAAALLELGRCEQAAQALDEAERLCRARNLQVQLSFVLTELGRLRNREGRSAEAVECFRAAQQCHRQQGREATLDAFLTEVELALTLARRGDVAGAAVPAEAASKLAATLGLTPDHPRLRIRTALADLQPLRSGR